MIMEDQRAGEHILPVVQEEATIGKRQVQTDRVRVRTIVEEYDTEVVAQVAREYLDVERRAADREVASPPPPREEGDTIIVSIVEERLVVEKRLFVIEELVLRRTSRTEDVHIPTTLRTMRAVIEQDSAQP